MEGSGPEVAEPARSGTFTVKKVAEETKEWQSGRGGPMLEYRIALVGPDEHLWPDVELSQKKDTKPPAEGQTFPGNIEDGKYRPKFRKEFTQGGRGGGGGGGRPLDPAETAAIQRQHSQQMALMYCQMQAARGAAMPDDLLKPPPDNADAAPPLRTITDWFDKDIKFAVDRFKADNNKPPASG